MVTSLSEVFKYCLTYIHQMIQQVESEWLAISFDMTVFLDLSSPLDSTYFFLKDLPFLMSIGDIDEAFRFLFIVIPFFVCLTLNPQNLKIPFSYVPVLNILFNSEIIFL